MFSNIRSLQSGRETALGLEMGLPIRRKRFLNFLAVRGLRHPAARAAFSWRLQRLSPKSKDKFLDILFGP